MTDLLPGVARQERAEVSPACSAPRHNSFRAWQAGCRCPGALVAHERRKETHRTSKTRRPAQVDEDGNCIAAHHGPSERAYLRGCRCPGSTELYEAALRRRREAWRGPNWAPPWDYWRGPDARVYRWNLFLLLRGALADTPTRGELTAAVHILLRSPNRWGTGMNTATDVATLLGIQRLHVWKVSDNIRRYRVERWRRRLADVKLRQHRREHAVAAGRIHDDRTGHPVHPLWMAAAYAALLREGRS